MDRPRRGRPRKLPKIDRFCTQVVKENKVNSGLMPSSSQEAEGVAQMSGTSSSCSEVNDKFSQKSADMITGNKSRNVWNDDMDDSFIDFRSPLVKKRKVQLKLPFANKQNIRKSQKKEVQVRSSLMSDSVPANIQKDEQCKVEYTSSSVEAKSVIELSSEKVESESFSAKVDSETSESTSADEAQQKNTSLCPMCWKRFDKVNITHLKACAAKYNMTTLQLMDAMALQEKQAAEREALGLPAVPNNQANKKPSTRKGSGASDNNDPNLQLALALSASMQDAEEQQILEQDEILIEAGLGQEVVAKQMTLLERFGFTSNRPALLTAANPRPRAKNKLKGFPTLLLRSEDERNRLITEKVALLLMSEESVPDENQIPSVELPIKSDYLQQYLSQECHLWNKASASPSRFEKSEYYVGNLSTFISPSKVEAGTKLRHLSQVPCRLKTPSKGFPFTTESADESPGRSYKPDLANSENLFIGMRESLPEKSVHSPTQTPKASNNETIPTSIAKSEPEVSVESNVQSVCKKSTGSINSVENLASDFPAVLNKDHSSCELISNEESEHKTSPESNVQSVCKKSLGSINSAENLASDWRAILNKSNMSDITIYVKNRLKIPAHELVFYVRCPAILTDIVLGDRNGKSILWTDISYRSALAFLEYIYCGNASKILSLSEGFEDVLWLTEKYGVTSLDKFFKVLTNVRGKITLSQQTNPQDESGSRNTHNAILMETELDHFQNMLTPKRTSPKKQGYFQQDETSNIAPREKSKRSVSNSIEMKHDSCSKAEVIGQKSQSPSVLSKSPDNSHGINNQDNIRCVSEDEVEHSQSILSPKYKSPRKYHPFSRNQTSKISPEKNSRHSITNSLKNEDGDSLNMENVSQRSSSPDPFAESLDKSVEINTQDNMNCLLELLDTSSPIQNQHNNSPEQDIKKISPLNVKEKNSEIHSDSRPYSKSPSERIVINSSQSSNESKMSTRDGNSPINLRRTEKLSSLRNSPGKCINEVSNLSNNDPIDSPSKSLVGNHSHVRKSLLRSFVSVTADPLQQEIMTYDLTQVSDDSNKVDLSPLSPCQADVVQCEPKSESDLVLNEKHLSCTSDEREKDRSSSELEDVTESKRNNENVMDVVELSSDDEANTSPKCPHQNESILSHSSGKIKMSNKVPDDNEKQFCISPSKPENFRNSSDSCKKNHLHEPEEISKSDNKMLEFSSDEKMSPTFSSKSSSLSRNFSDRIKMPKKLLSDVEEICKLLDKPAASQKSSKNDRKDSIKSPSKIVLSQKSSGYIPESPGKSRLSQMLIDDQNNVLESPNPARECSDDHEKEYLKSPTKFRLSQKSTSNHRKESFESPSKIIATKKSSVDYRKECLDSPSKTNVVQRSPGNHKKEYLLSPSKNRLSQKLSENCSKNSLESPSKMNLSQNLSDETKRKYTVIDSPNGKSDAISKKPRRGGDNSTEKNLLGSSVSENEVQQEKDDIEVIFDLTQTSDSPDRKPISSPLNISESSKLELTQSGISPLRSFALSPRRRITNKFSPGQGSTRMHDESLNKIKELIANDMSPKGKSVSPTNQDMNSSKETVLRDDGGDENLNDDKNDCEPPPENSVDYNVNEIDYFDYDDLPCNYYTYDPPSPPGSNRSSEVKDERLNLSQNFDATPDRKKSPTWKKVLSQDSVFQELKNKSVEIVDLDDSGDNHPPLTRCNSDSELSKSNKKRNSLEACKRLLEDSFVDQLGELSWRDDLETADAVAYSTPKALKTPVQRLKAMKSHEVTPLADYSAMSTPTLKKELHKYGIKPLKKKQAKIILRHIYNELHPVVEETDDDPEKTSPFKEPGPDTVVPKSPVKKNLIKQIISSPKKGNNKATSQPLEHKSGDSDDEDASSLSSSQSSSVSSTRSDLFAVDDLQDEPGLSQKDSSDLPDVVRNYILSDPKLHEKVLLYEPIWLEQLHGDLKAMKYKFKLDQLMHFLDGQCITFRTSQQQKTNARRTARKKNSPKNKSPKKKPVTSKRSEKEGTKERAPRKKKVSASSSQNSSDPLSR